VPGFLHAANITFDKNRRSLRRRVYNSAMYCYGIKSLRFPLNMPLVKATIAKFTQHSTTV